ncbi:hypothetical protein ZWY2020_019802 [Hordeum vulgare]|nr:hypothetical protein ZWY2020_019802 [Hordeum vulgare]
MDANSRPTQGSDPATGGGGGGGGADPTAPSATGAQLQQEACGKIINKIFDLAISVHSGSPSSTLRRSSDLHARYGPVISIRLFRALVFVSDRRLAHRVLVQGGSTFADRSRLFEPGLIFTFGSRNINAAPYGPYWRLVRRNLASEALHPACVSQFAPARRQMRDTLVRDLRVRAGAGDPVEVRTLFWNAMFNLLVYMSLGVRLAPEVLDEMQDMQLWVVRAIIGFPIFSFFPALTKRLFRKRWEAHLAVPRRQDEILLLLIEARRSVSVPRGADDPPCYADSLLALRGGQRPPAHGL